MRIPRAIPRALSRAGGLAVLALSAVLLTAAGPGRAERNEGGAEQEPDRAALGAMSYRIHCLSCHGRGGGGGGPMAQLLKIQPADLTRLAEESGGRFPGEKVYRAIDGRDEIGGHGSREMPVWGIGFQDLGRSGAQEEAVRARILDLIAYVETLQGGGETPAD